jgi:hypothetical protein
MKGRIARSQQANLCVDIGNFVFSTRTDIHITRLGGCLQRQQLLNFLKGEARRLRGFDETDPPYGVIGTADNSTRSPAV